MPGGKPLGRRLRRPGRSPGCGTPAEKRPVRDRRRSGPNRSPVGLLSWSVVRQHTVVLDAGQGEKLPRNHFSQRKCFSCGRRQTGFVGWVERSEPHQNRANSSWWGSLRSTHPTVSGLPQQSQIGQGPAPIRPAADQPIRPIANSSARMTPMMLSPAMQPEAIGTVYISFHLAALLSRTQTVSAEEHAKALKGGGGQGDAQGGRRGRVGLGLGKDVVHDDNDHAHHEGDGHRPQRARRQAAEALGEHLRHAFPYQRRGGGELLAAEDIDVGHEEEVGGHRHHARRPGRRRAG